MPPVNLIQDLPRNWYNRFDFYQGVTSPARLPEDIGSEVAFAGRSNVGKSSTVNTIIRRKSLARTSKTPGRTREINFFSYDHHTRIVDLPGYGYARVNVSTRNRWSKLLENYLEKRRCLQGVFLIFDIRHPLGKFDRVMLEYCQGCHLPVHVLLNKTDKVSKNTADKTLDNVKKQLHGENISVQLFSARDAFGVDRAREKLATWLFCKQ